METLLVGLKSSLILTITLLCIILPLSIGYELLKERVTAMGSGKRSFLGISTQGLLPLVTGLIIGLTYGAGIIIHSLRTSRVKRHEAFLILLFLSVCHAIIEDTLIFVVIGANGVILVVFRLLVAALFTYLCSKTRFFKGS